MNFLKKRSGAVIVAILVILLSTFIGVNRSLGKACQEVSDSFYSGVYDADWGASRTSISSQLTKRQGAALGVISIASAYAELDDYANDLRDAREDMLSAEGASDSYRANVELEKCFNSLLTALDTVSLSDPEKENVAAYSTTFTGAQNVIDNSGYNEAVREFNRKVLNVFPTNFLSAISFVEKPELFE